MRTACAVLLVTGAAALFAAGEPKPAEPKPDAKPRFAGPTETGFLLPNGWHLTPAGKHVETTDLPLNILPLKDGKHAVVTTNGFNQHTLYLIDLTSGKVAATEKSRQSWYGLALSKAEDKVWWSGGGHGELHTFDLTGGAFARTSKLEPDLSKLTREEIAKLREEMAAKPSFKSGLCLDEKKGVLYSLDINAGSVTAVGLKGGAEKTAKLGGRPYDVVRGRNGLLYVSDWAGRPGPA